MTKDSTCGVGGENSFGSCRSRKKNMEIAVLTADKPMEMLSNESLDSIVKKIEKEKAEKEEEKTKG